MYRQGRIEAAEVLEHGDEDSLPSVDQLHDDLESGCAVEERISTRG